VSFHGNVVVGIGHWVCVCVDTNNILCIISSRVYVGFALQLVFGLADWLLEIFDWLDYILPTKRNITSSIFESILMFGFQHCTFCIFFRELLMRTALTTVQRSGEYLERGVF